MRMTYPRLNDLRQIPHAWDQYNKIMSQREVVDIPDDAVCNVLNRYLTWVQQNRADATYKKCRLHLRRFAVHWS